MRKTKKAGKKIDKTAPVEPVKAVAKPTKVSNKAKPAPKVAPLPVVPVKATAKPKKVSIKAKAALTVAPAAAVKGPPKPRGRPRTSSLYPQTRLHAYIDGGAKLGIRADVANQSKDNKPRMTVASILKGQIEHWLDGTLDLGTIGKSVKRALAEGTIKPDGVDPRRVSADLPEPLYFRFKAACASQGISMSAAVAEMVDAWLDKKRR